MDEQPSYQTPSKKPKPPQSPNPNPNPTPNPNPNPNSDLYVWPWMGVISNIPTQIQQGRHVGQSGAKLKAQLSQFCPSKVSPIWTYKGHTGFAVIFFQKDWYGFKNAMDFHSHFQTLNRGKENFVTRREKTEATEWVLNRGKTGFEQGIWNRGNNRGDLEQGIYGWVAKGEDYTGNDELAGFLKKNGDLKSIGEVQCGELAMSDRFVKSLAREVESKNGDLREMESRCVEKQGHFERILGEKDELLRIYNEGMVKMEELSNNHLRRIMDANLKLQEDLELKKKEAEQANQKLLEGKKISSGSVSKLSKDMKSLELATLEKQKVDEKVWNLVEEQKREKDSALQRILQLERQLEAKHSLQLEIHQLTAQLERIEPQEREKMERMREELSEKLEEMEEIETLNQTLVVKEKRSSEELDEARDVLIKGLEERSSGVVIGIKKMGEISEKAFRKACEIKFHRLSVTREVELLLEKWQNEIQNPNWNPLKTELCNGSMKEVINEQDEKLQELKKALGDEAVEALKTALLEIKEFNPVRKFPVPEIWNFKENRKATMVEATRCTLNGFKLYKKKRARE